MSFNLDNYETVKDRITRFYKDHADGRILTELVNDPSSLASFAAFKSSVYIGETLKATGYAMEQQGQGVNKDAWVENAETSAIGRALANMDYCGTLRPSREEMSKVSQPAGDAEEVKGKLSEYVASGLLSDKAVTVINAAINDPKSTYGALIAMLATAKLRYEEAGGK